jgi:hypothetical protein
MPNKVIVIAQIDEVIKPEPIKGPQESGCVRDPVTYRHTLLIRENTIVSFYFRTTKGNNRKLYRLVIGRGEEKYVQWFACPDDIKVYIYREGKLVGVIRDMSKLFFRATKVRLQVMGQDINTQYILKIHL